MEEIFKREDLPIMRVAIWQWCTKQPFLKTSSKKSQLQWPVSKLADSSNSQVPVAKRLKFYDIHPVHAKNVHTVLFDHCFEIVKSIFSIIHVLREGLNTTVGIINVRVEL